MEGSGLDVAAFRLLYPTEFFTKFFSEGVRPDGRPLGACRPTNIGFDAVPSADGSSLVKIGNTTMLASVKLEIIKPAEDSLNLGRIEFEFDMPPLCSPKIRPGRTAEDVFIVAEEVRNVLTSSTMLNLEQLCIEPGKAAWLARVDVLCLDDDGALIDAALLACTSALADVRIPEVKLSAKGKVIPASAAQEEQGTSDPANEKRDRGKRLALGAIPVALTCAFFGPHMLVDPTAEELCLDCSTLTTILDTQSNVVSLFKPGGSQKATVPIIQDCIAAAELRCQEVWGLLWESCEGAIIPAPQQ